MTTFRLRISVARSIFAIISGLLALFFYTGGAAHSAFAAPVQTVPSQSVMIPAGGSATVQVRAYSTQPGAALPQGPLALAQPAFPADRVRISLYYGIDWGYADTNSDQVAQAIWFAQTGTWQSPDHTIADRIANAAAGAPGLPFWNTDGQSLVTLTQQGSVTVSPLALAADGTGQLTVTNAGSQDLTVYLPYGTLFAGASGSAIVWAVGSGGVQGPTPTTQAASPTTQPVATATATATQAQPSPTASVYVKPGTSPTEQPTTEATATQVSIKGAPTATQLTSDATPTKAADQPPSGLPPVNNPTQAATATPQPSLTASVTPSATAVHYVKPGTGTTDSPPPVVPTQAAPTNTPKPAATEAHQKPLAPVAQQEEASAKTGSKQQSSNEAAPIVNAPPIATTAAAPPAPVSTQQGQSAPAPVNTGQPQVPNPQQTGEPTLPPTKPTEPPTPTKVIPTPPGNPGSATDNSSPTPVPPTKAPIVPAPTPLPTTGGGNDNNVPTIIVSPNNDPAQPKPTPAPAPGAGPTPTTSPITGGGESALPAWLSLFSALMLLGGWTLRRMSSQVAATAEVTAETPEEDS